MPNGPVQSFGRRGEPQPDPAPQAVMLPPMVLPPVHCPLVLVVHPDGLREAAEQIQALVAAAVRAGVAQGLAERLSDSTAGEAAG